MTVQTVKNLYIENYTLILFHKEIYEKPINIYLLNDLTTNVVTLHNIKIGQANKSARWMPWH